VICGIVLVGGFGQSNYLYSKMKAHFNSAPPPPYTERPTHAVALNAPQTIEVMHPMYAWTAVVRGAVLRGLEGSMVQSRRSRWHYGTSYATVFDEARHPISDRYWSPLWERWMVSDRMQWHIAKVRSFTSIVPALRDKANHFICLGCPSLRIPTHLLPLHAQLPPRPVSRSRGRPDRLRR
jgi:hypothetical protein